MALTKRWAGKAWGTNIGNLFVTLEGEDTSLSGTLRINDPEIGIAVYKIQGTYEAPVLKLKGQSQSEIEDVEFGQLSAVGTMTAHGDIKGDWETSVGSAGTFVLHPHTGSEQTDDDQRVEQFHTARHSFGAIEIDREQIIKIAESIRREFPRVIVTVVAGTEQARFLEDFRQLQFSINKADIIKIFASKPDGSGSNQVISIEFGPEVNTAMTQGANEAWVLGQLETLKRDLKQYERTYVTSFKRWGIGINQIMLLSVIVFLPSLSGLGSRAILMISVLALILSVNWLHSRYIPFAAIYLRKKEIGLVGRIWPRVLSWSIGIVAAVISALLGAYLEGRFKISADQPLSTNSEISSTPSP